MQEHYAYAWACKQRNDTTFCANAFLTGPQGLERGGSSTLATAADFFKVKHFYDYFGFEHYTYTYYYRRKPVHLQYRAGLARPEGETGMQRTWRWSSRSVRSCPDAPPVEE